MTFMTNRDLKAAYGKAQTEYQQALEKHRDAQEALRQAEAARAAAWCVWRRRLGEDRDCD